MEDQVVTSGLLALWGTIMVVGIIWAIIAYVLSAFALSTMAKAQGLEDHYFAFIPVLNWKIWGDLVEARLPDALRPQAGWKVVGVFVSLFILNLIPFINFISTIASAVFGIWLLYLILERYTTNSVIFTVLHVVTSCLFLPLHLFLIRKNAARF